MKKLIIGLMLVTSLMAVPVSQADAAVSLAGVKVNKVNNKVGLCRGRIELVFSWRLEDGSIQTWVLKTLSDLHNMGLWIVEQGGLK